jgi:hypothetical protein
MRDQTLSRATGLALGLALIAVIAPHAACADTFQSASYDPGTDELVIVMAYQGTNPDHQFSLTWERCIDRGDDRRTIVAEVLDQQFQDAARQDFTKTVRVSMADMNCRPAVVTLKTAPGFRYTVTIPARAGDASKP